MDNTEINHSSPENGSTISRRLERVLVGLIVFAHTVLAIGFSLGPIFEGPDEIFHYEFVRSIAQARALPDPNTGGEFYQAPLYYILSAPTAGLVQDEEFSSFFTNLNPWHSQFSEWGNDNKNIYQHTQAENFPYTGSNVARAVHLVRLFSVGLGTVTVIISYATFGILWPNRADRRLLALGFVAFWPLMTYLSGIVSNDTLVTLFATLSFYLLLRQQRDGPSWRGAALLGVALGAALLSKTSGLLLVFPVGLAVMLDRRTWRYAPLTLAITFAVSGWWYIRNTLLFGDPTGLRSMLLTWSWSSQTIRPALRLDLTQGLQNAPQAYQYFWARFAYNTIYVSDFILRLYDILTAAALVGMLVWAVRWANKFTNRTPEHALATRQALVIGIAALAWIAALIGYSGVVYNGFQPRFLLPMAFAWGAIIALGTDAWTPVRLRTPAALSTIAALAIVAYVTLFAYFLPSYGVRSVPGNIEHPLSLRFDDAAELIGTSSDFYEASPGETIRVKLYWRAISPSDTKLFAYLHSLPSDVVKRDSLPGTGNLLATDWRSGQTWVENYVVRIPSYAEPQVVYPLIAGLYDPATDTPLPAIDESGDTVLPIVGHIAIRGEVQPFEPDYRFGEEIGLAVPDIIISNDQVQVCLDWVALASTTIDYHVFIHVLGDDGQLIIGNDSQPRDGTYPTHVWVPGETISDCIALHASELPANGWYVGVGLYELASGQRLAVQDLQGQPLRDNMVLAQP